MSFFHQSRWPAILLTTALLILLPGFFAPVRAALVVSVVTAQAEAPVADILSAFREQFTTAGEELSLTVYSLAEDEPTIAEQIAAIKAQKPQVLFLLGSRALNYIATQFTTTPIVFSLVLSEQMLPRQSNVTGVLLDFPVETQLDWLHRLLPKAKNIGVIYSPQENAARIQTATVVAQQLGLRRCKPVCVSDLGFGCQ